MVPKPQHQTSAKANDSQRNVNNIPKGKVSTQKKILLLHGNCQTGQLLLGRLERLQRRIRKEFQFEVIAPDAPFEVKEDATRSENGDEGRHLLTWWTRTGDDYEGLDETLRLLQVQEWNNPDVIGIMGFSQGARLTHLLSLLHNSHPQQWFPSLKFVIMVSGYDAPLPKSCYPLQASETPLSLPSLHVWGTADSLVSPSDSEAVTKEYLLPHTHVHPGKHFVPTKNPDIAKYLEFIQQAIDRSKTVDENLQSTQSHKQRDNIDTAQLPKQMAASNSLHSQSCTTPVPGLQVVPDEETMTMQREEVQALEAIFPDEIEVKSPVRLVDGESVLQFPIMYHLKLRPADGVDPLPQTTNWPPRPLALEIRYPSNYPSDEIPLYKLLHENNSFEFPSRRGDRLMSVLLETSNMELGMPSVLSAVYAVREYLDSQPEEGEEENPIVAATSAKKGEESVPPDFDASDAKGRPLIAASSPESIQQCNLEGLQLAERILNSSEFNSPGNGSTSKKSSGGSTWNYVIGLVGKPSAGKSTFFNAATGFSRQRCDDESSEWGGASMAAHPFTTIDPNIGYCLIPAPFGSCPEDEVQDRAQYASTHGRSPDGRRFLPVLLKDVAGLVPGAYQGRGRGNQFLNDLTDATVLIHVVDASGTADAQGNKTVSDDETSDLTNPLDDLAWIRNELVEWVYGNLAAKWDAVVRRGRVKLSGMFSGYGQRDVVTQIILTALEKYLDEAYQRERSLESFTTWDQGDIHRLVSTFLGVRFPMALALNKCDLPSSRDYVELIQDSLPIHGAHVGTPMAAKREMTFVRNHLKNKGSTANSLEGSPPISVWQCLTSAMMLRPPVLVFPVNDMVTYAPLPGLNRDAAETSSLPSHGMVGCILAAGGSSPTCWDEAQNGYTVPSKEKSSRQRLRDVLLMKPGSTVEDVFFALKRLGAMGGEFVRAEAAASIGDKPKPVAKLEVVGRKHRIIKIMSNKRTAWQS